MGLVWSLRLIKVFGSPVTKTPVMRTRLAALGIIAVLGATTATPVSASPSADAPKGYGGAGADQFADVFWIEQHKGYLKIFTVFLGRAAHGDSGGNVAAGASVSASVHKCVPQGRFFKCARLRSIRQDLAPGEYEYDPLMETASVRFRGNHIRWRATSDIEPIPMTWGHHDAYGWGDRYRAQAFAVTGAWAYRAGKAEGTLFGKQIPRNAGAVLATDAEVFAIARACVHTSKVVC